MIYYLIHSAKWWGKSMEDGKRNCLTFMIGSYVWFFIFMTIQYLSGGNKNSLFELAKANFMILIGIDAAVMAYTYKTFYGRSILHELADNNNGWIYHSGKHKYIKYNPGNLTAYQESRYGQLKQKNNLKQIVKIQRWWKELFYSPHKKGYQLSKADFEDAIGEGSLDDGI